MRRIGENRNDEANRIAIREDGRIRRKYDLPVMVGGYCRKCHYHNNLNKDGICDSCLEVKKETISETLWRIEHGP